MPALRGGVRVKVARNLKRENLADALLQLSDSIVEKVVKTKKAVIVSDALHDQEFSNAMSVMSLKLSSVMCVPLLERGNLLGVLYVGNDSVAQLYDESHLEVLTIFAAQASLIIRNGARVFSPVISNIGSLRPTTASRLSIGNASREVVRAFHSRMLSMRGCLNPVGN